VFSRKSDAPEHPDLVVSRTPGEPKTRIFGVVKGINPPLNILVHSDDINTLERAVKERVFFVVKDGEFVAPPLPKDDAVFFKRLLPFSEAIRTHLPRTAPMTAANFAGMYQGRKARVYGDAVESLQRDDFTVKDAHIKVFVKLEKVNFTAKPDAVPRVISPRDPRFNVKVGRYLRQIEDRLYGSIAKVYGDKTVIKGLNALESAAIIKSKWDYFDDPVAVGLDASRFDQHVSQSALRWEHRVYEQCFPIKKHKEELQRLLSLQLVNHCKGFCLDGKLQYTAKGGRMSGDMNTGLGNCLLMCAMIYSYAADILVNIKLANNGDDCVVFMERSDLEKFVRGVDKFFVELGFTMVVEAPVFHLEHVSFCQTQPVCSGIKGEYIMVRDPRIAVAKDCVSTTWYPTPVLRRGWLHAVGVGGLALTGGIPVLQEFYLAMARGGKYSAKVANPVSWGVKQLGKGMNRPYTQPTAETRASFWLAFGITPEQQLASELLYSKAVVQDGGSVEETRHLLPFYNY